MKSNSAFPIGHPEALTSTSPMKMVRHSLISMFLALTGLTHSLWVSADVIDSIDGIVDINNSHLEYDWRQDMIEASDDPFLPEETIVSTFWRETDDFVFIGVAYSLSVTNTIFGIRDLPGDARKRKLEDLLDSDHVDLFLSDSEGNELGSVTQDVLCSTNYGSEDCDPEEGDFGSSVSNVNGFDPDMVIDSASSIAYNLNQVAPQYDTQLASGNFDDNSQSPDIIFDPLTPDIIDTLDPALAEWVFVLTLELQLDRDLFRLTSSGASLAAVTIVDLNISPNNLSDGSIELKPAPVPVPIPVPVSVPEPTAIVMMMFGLLYIIFNTHFRLIPRIPARVNIGK